MTWVCQELGLIFGNRLLHIAMVEGLINSLLLLFGMDEEPLVQVLGPSLQSCMATFVNQLIDVTVQWCSRLLGLEDGHAARGREGSPVAAPALLPPKTDLPHAAQPTLSALKKPI